MWPVTHVALSTGHPALELSGPRPAADWAKPRYRAPGVRSAPTCSRAAHPPRIPTLARSLPSRPSEISESGIGIF
eukprot:1853255-Alexandrium_andersonii.AAC.1